MTRERRLAASCYVLAALALPLGALAQKSPLGNEFQVNSYTTYSDRAPAAAASASGDFVVAWNGHLDRSGYGISARRFSSAGAPLAGEFQVNTVTLNSQRYPSVAASSSGDFVVTWQSNGQDDSSSYGIFASRFSSAGVPLASEFQVNDFTLSNQLYSSVAASATGDFVVVWESSTQDGSLQGIFARRFSSAGAPLASEFQVNTYTLDSQRYPSVAASASGDFVVAWHSNLQDGSYRGVFARRFSSAGAPLASEFQVNTHTSNNQRFPSVAADADGDFVVAWESFGQDGSSNSVFARRFSGTGAPLTDEFQVNTYTTGYQRSPSVAASASGGFVVAWASYPQDGSGYGIFAQRFATLATLDIDGNGSLGPLTDGLLVLRFLFGFTSTTLTGGAVGAGCTRCDAAAIQPYLAGLGLVLDVDGNTMAGALTDGLLVLRYLFGFTSTTLTTGDVGGGCARCDAAAIEAYLAGLTN